MNLGKTFKMLRKRRGNTLRVVSIATQIPIATLSRIERNTHPISKENIKTLCDYFGITEGMLYMLAFEQTDFTQDEWLYALSFRDRFVSLRMDKEN